MISDRLKEERKRAGFTQEEVADYLGTDRSTYAYYETGKIKIPLDVLDRVAELFGIPNTFYLYSPSPILEFRSDDLLSLTEDEKSKLEEFPFVEKTRDAEPQDLDITSEERYMLAKIRLLVQSGKERTIQDFLDDLMDNLSDQIGD